MHALVAHQQTEIWDPNDPTQRVRQMYNAVPGTWGSYYFNRLPNAGGSTLKGLGSWAGIPATGQLAIVFAVSALAGYFGWKRYGDKHLRPALKKVPIVGGLMGARRARRR